ncbi:transcriptional regulator [Mesorhizobium sp. SARCC-RB16n]|nr:transcriptional regulator [Mesorhizobium sp. SARCC-RB16n]
MSTYLRQRLAEIKAGPALRGRPRSKGRPSRRQLSDASKLFAAMGFSKRLLIVIQLMEGERTVSDLVSLVGGNRTALSRHLSGMAKLGIVQYRTEAKWRYYACTLEHSKTVVRLLSDLAENDKLPIRKSRSGLRSGSGSSSWRPG